MGRMWRGGYRRFHPIGDRMGNEMVDVFDVGQPICDLDMEYGIYKVPAKEVIPYRIYPVLSPAWKADGYDELGIIYDRYLDLLVTYVVEGESETNGYAAAIVTYDNLDTFGLPRGKLFEYASRNLKSDIRIGFTGTTEQLAMLEIGRLSGGVGGASALLLSYHSSNLVSSKSKYPASVTSSRRNSSYVSIPLRFIIAHHPKGRKCPLLCLLGLSCHRSRLNPPFLYFSL